MTRKRTRTRRELRTRGIDIRKELGGGKAFQSSVPALERLAPALQEVITEAVFGGVWARGGLTTRQHSMVSISVLTVLGRMPPLRGHIENALNIGVNPDEIIEVLMHLAFYSGVPAANAGIGLAGEVFAERNIDYMPADAGSDAELSERLEAGRQIQHEMWRGGEEPLHLLKQLDPEMEQLVSEYLFGTIYQRRGLSMEDRSLCTIAALTAEGQTDHLRYYVRSGLNVGLTEHQIIEILFHTAFYSGLPRSLEAIEIAADVFANKTRTESS